jgi:putative addiction module component (TIGR02574 family)
MPVFDDILDAARTLTPTDRMRLVEALWEDVAPSEWPLPSGEWIAEARRRSDEHDQGRTSPAPWSEVRVRARKKACLE